MLKQFGRSALVAVALSLFTLVDVSVASSPATFAEAKALAAKENKPLLIDFYAVW